MDDASTVLLRRLHRVGCDAEEAIPAFAGAYPGFNGLGSLAMFFSKDRVLTRLSSGIQLWAALSGPTPTELIGTYQPHDLQLVDDAVLRFRNDRFQLGDKRLWVHRRYRQTLGAWMQAPLS